MTVPSELIDVILRRTQEGKIPWRELSNTGLTANIEPNSITIDFLARGRYALTVSDERGAVLERTESASWDEDKLKEIYEIARRQALRVDDALANLRRNLEKL